MKRSISATGILHPTVGFLRPTRVGNMSSTMSDTALMITKQGKRGHVSSLLMFLATRPEAAYSEDASSLVRSYDSTMMARSALRRKKMVMIWYDQMK